MQQGSVEINTCFYYFLVSFPNSVGELPKHCICLVPFYIYHFM